MEEAFCVVCGRSDRPVQDGLCTDCFVDRTPLVRVAESRSIVLCPQCGARLVGQHWEGRGRPTILGAADLAPMLEVHPEAGLRKVDWTDESHDPLLRTLTGRAHLRFRGTERTQAISLTVRIVHRTCTECSRRSGHFYTATIQLRGAVDGARERPAERRERLWRRWDAAIVGARPEWRNALSWSEAATGGWDFYLVDTLAARGIARMFKAKHGARLTESATLWGRKNGQDVYRVTFCVRLPDPGAGAAPPPEGRRRSRAAPRVER